MTHDLMCPSNIPHAHSATATVGGVPRPVEVLVRSGPCQCDLIGKVRADTLDKARQLVTALACPITVAEGHCEECEQYREVLACIDFLKTT